MLQQKLSIKSWLIACCLMVLLMILLGGITRLSDAGLAIVEWKPVVGVIPPLNDAQWQDEFIKYQQFPEYQQRNIQMQLAEFKFIFWLEFIHRLAARLMGLLYALPLLYLWLNKKIDQKAMLIYFIILILFFMQGFMGWYMVKSGLIVSPHVSHFRLSAHLVIAVLIYNLLFYQLMQNNFDILLISCKTRISNQKFWCLLSLTVVYLQIIVGGLVAGLGAGLIYNSFPLMGNSFIPEEVTFTVFNIQSFSQPVFIQFIHRIGAYIVCISTMCLAISLFKTAHLKLKKVAYSILSILTLQMAAGIILILYSRPILIALVHQIFAVILLSYISWCYFLLKSTEESKGIKQIC
ncbi:COX15/CtaA family protein [Candidatus Tisiphia endosymbiont of Nemotelus uliginosus]|uniref:COX15/CtaA family protein n=1 Tax=Candidatus Tisiphia endosymbiont of Nemotelus uliginosus TaxID=3077926 RepID=UPI0035C8E055